MVSPTIEDFVGFISDYLVCCVSYYLTIVSKHTRSGDNHFITPQKASKVYRVWSYTM